MKVDPADWEMRDDGRGTYTVFLKKPIEARVVKVRSKYNDRGEDMAPVDKATFTNSLEKAIDVQPKVNEAFLQYEYDAAGNRTTQYFTVVLTHETHYQYYANSNRLLTDGKWAYVYDANGNLVKKGNQYQIAGEQVIFTTDGPFAEVWEYGYDLLNRLVTVKKNGTQVSSYVYDPTGLRVVKRGSKGETHYAFDLGGNAIYEKDIATGKERSYVWVGGQHFARVDGGIGGTGAKYFYHTDHEGSLTVVTDTAGTVVWRSDHLPFGQKIEQDKEDAFAEDHGFTGKEWDQDTGLYYYNARWYDPDLGRFTTEDAWPTEPNNPLTLNEYTYALGNPLVNIDPTGHFSIGFQASGYISWGAMRVEGDLNFVTESAKGGQFKFKFQGNLNQLNKNNGVDPLVNEDLASADQVAPSEAAVNTETSYNNLVANTLTETEKSTLVAKNGSSIYENRTFLSADAKDKPGVNPTREEVINYIRQKARELGIPEQLALATAQTENKMRQFNKDGTPAHEGDDWGLMQINEISHPEAFTTKWGDIKNNWKDNVNYGLNYLKDCYARAKILDPKQPWGQQGMKLGESKMGNNSREENLARAAYALYNSGSSYYRYKLTIGEAKARGLGIGAYGWDNHTGGLDEYGYDIRDNRFWENYNKTY